ncbi:C2H2-type zinc-finger protein, partial [Rhizoctonia solani 123E]
PSPFAPPGPLTARPHVCELCDSGFARAHDLKRHLETHKGERPHKCPNCQRSFSRKDAVQRHIVVTKCGTPGS